MLIRTAAENQHLRADHVIIPDVAHLRPDEIGKMEEFVELGETAALASLEKIEELIYGMEV